MSYIGFYQEYGHFCVELLDGSIEVGEFLLKNPNGEVQLYELGKQLDASAIRAVYKENKSEIVKLALAKLTADEIILLGINNV